MKFKLTLPETSYGDKKGSVTIGDENILNKCEKQDKDISETSLLPLINFIN